MAIYLLENGASPTTAPLVPVTTGTAASKTLLQVKMLTGVQGKIREWGVSFFGSAAATPIRVELVETGTVFATVTAMVAADINKVDDPNAPDPTIAGFSVGTAATGYTASAEGTITAARKLDAAKGIPPTSGYDKQFPVDALPRINVSTAMRIRVFNPGTAVDAYAYVVIEI